MGIFSNVASKITIALACKNIPSEVEESKLKFASSDIEGGIKAVRKLQESVYCIISSVLRIEGVNVDYMTGDESIDAAFNIIQSKACYAKTKEAMTVAMTFFANIDDYKPRFEPAVEELHSILFGGK